jgi:hypothetical protein
VKSRHEKAVAERLRARSVEIYLPLHGARRRWSDRIKTIDPPLFSRYVFCRCGFDDRLKVLQISGAKSIVGFGGKPGPIPATKSKPFKALVSSGLPVLPWPFLRIGYACAFRRAP